ncbi:MAG: hypothetical protein EXR98_05965 [Gemmataceae bacterium]|nr:hypothetical protein [Gemmataceae bacterium]
MTATHTSVDDYDLDRHGVVEASAGTGKTYTIERLVLRLLREEAVALEQILIVTFTEKATGDLKRRLRDTLDRASQANDDQASLVKKAIESFDQASIFTIHGFCQRTLKDYALEQSQDFRPALVDDFDLLKVLLREIQRKDWRRTFGSNLRAVLERAGYGGEQAEAWDRNVLEVAKSYKPRSGHQLRPEFQPDWWRHLDKADAAPAGQLEIFTVRALLDKMRESKRQRGQHSFDDMIAAVEESLDPAQNANAVRLLGMLRERYRYGIVDEFQDTDPLQWRIFRRIFCEAGDSKLFIVGDPKQAIFGFRGADLPTYLAAAEEMTATYGADAHPLVENWRSDPDLLDALNCLFGDGEWFSKETGIRYLPVHPPDDDKRQSYKGEDHTDRAALTLVDVTNNETIKKALKHYARFIAYEIDRLLARHSDKPLLSFTLKGNAERPLHAGDICILVMMRRDAEPITQALDTAGIPFSFYKQAGLWQSEEAIHLEVMLQALTRPEDRSSFRKALLTCFFRVAPADLAHCPDVPMQHPARQLYQTWLGYVENRQWSALFRSMLEDTGLLFPATDDGGSGRRVTTLRQLLATLEEAGHGENLDLLGLLDWIRRRRQQRGTGEADMQPDEMGRAKVKIMTIHASKGLEFPIVFLGGGFTKGLGSKGPAKYRDDDGRLIFDFTPDANPDAKKRVNDDAQSEYRRLLYVALTRPMFKLYLPKVQRPARTVAWLGPVGTILLPALEQACPDKNGPLIADVVVPPLALAVVKPYEKPDSAAPRIAPISLTGPLFPRIDGNLSKRRIVIRSFSSMARHHLSNLGEGSSFGEQTPLALDETPTTLDQDDPLRGPVFGDMVHTVLESIDFAEVGRATAPDDLCRAGTHARKLLDQALKANLAKLRSRVPIDQLEDACRQQIATLVWQALRTPLQQLGGPLCEIPKEDRRHEVDFLFPERPGAAPPADTRWEEGFVTGFMDLLFRKNDQYYLLDWKTNLLPAYTAEQIERSMADSDYHRQYRLYLHAARRWLERVHGPKFSFLDRFGGVYYLYVRGLNGRDDTIGVYFHRPNAKELELSELLNP